MDRLDELRHRYAKSLPQKGRDLDAAWRRWLASLEDRDALADLHQHVHRLSGSAPAYGFEDLGALAQPLDAMFAEWINADPAQRLPARALADRMASRMQALVQALAF
ncbi:Hpt domain-containing protein [Tahibacter amnicola]|uniref:Hpt domain-containing protein n=1 Tax=Tahibacter amnicola TaxID=2976241 RepID=A0ABY6BHD9_9GAMM|nr:Hpt domain-containing protein [Tahibacter amnicola]UXI69189.1 Hpt domain-containing protein [Tahibacter amnicola]